MSETLLVGREAGVLTLTLNRPESGNAFDLELAERFRDAAQSAGGDPGIRVIVIRAAGRLFCAGGDVAAMNAAADPTAYVVKLGQALADAALALADGPAIVVAAVQGAAAGAGLGVVLNSDIVLSGPDARYLSAYAAVGFVPDTGVSRRLPEVVGPRRARELALLGRVLTATEARDWGIVTEVLADVGELDERVDAVVATLRAGAPRASAATKRLLSSTSTGYAEHLAEEVAGLREVMADDRTRELLAEVLGRRR